MQDFDHEAQRRLLRAVADDALLTELVKLHRPMAYGSRTAFDRYPRCTAEFSGGDGEYIDWPCETVDVIARHRGVDLRSQTIDSTAVVLAGEISA